MKKERVRTFSGEDEQSQRGRPHQQLEDPADVVENARRGEGAIFLFFTFSKL